MKKFNSGMARCASSSLFQIVRWNTM